MGSSPISSSIVARAFARMGTEGENKSVDKDRRQCCSRMRECGISLCLFVGKDLTA
jgi:hypothetical protein